MRQRVYCLTPVKNESWILDRFLKCASMWADCIIIADQGSTDRSREIARQFPKVTLVDNNSSTYNEAERQLLLIAEARRHPGPKVLLALDADEFLTANVFTSPDWQSILGAPPGTVISLRWPEIVSSPDGLSFFYFPSELPIGFVDDGSVSNGTTIHSTRVPVPPGAQVLSLTDIELMHYCQYDRERFKSKIRWYQCFEYLTLGRRPIDLFRFYHRDLFVSPEIIEPVPRTWIQGYEEAGIDLASIPHETPYRWDREVLQYFHNYGTQRFKRLAIWDVDWNKVSVDLYGSASAKHFVDPRNAFDKLVHKWLQTTEPDFAHYARRPIHRRLANKLVYSALHSIGW